MKARDYIGHVKSLPCVLCTLLGQKQETVTHAHHPRFGQGISQRASDWLVAGLCKDCHQGKLGVHGDRTLLRIAKVEEMDLVALTVQAVFKRCIA
jgi:hypothetical protein